MFNAQYTQPNSTINQAPRKQRGLTLIEILVSLVIGLIIVGGVWKLLVGSRDSFSTSQNQAVMLDNARYALHALGRDLKHAGSFGQLNKPQLIVGQAAMPAASGDCANQFYIDVARKVYGVNLSSATESNPFNGTCIPNSRHQSLTDILVVRYAEPTAIADNNMNGNTAFIQSNHSRGQLFVSDGTAASAPGFAADLNYRLVSHVYYVDVDTESGDGIPSLRRLSLIAGATGPEMQNEVVVSGVENMQVQYGIDRDACYDQSCPNVVNSYVDADNSMFGTGNTWPDVQAVNQIQAVKIWLLVRADSTDQGIGAQGPFTLGNVTVAAVSDDIRRAVYTGVFSLRNSVN